MHFGGSQRPDSRQKRPAGGFAGCATGTISGTICIGRSASWRSSVASFSASVGAAVFSSPPAGGVVVVPGAGGVASFGGGAVGGGGGGGSSASARPAARRTCAAAHPRSHAQVRSVRARGGARHAVA